MGWDGRKSLKALILRAPLCGANNTKNPKTLQGEQCCVLPELQKKAGATLCMVPGEGGRIVKSKQPHLALACAPIVYDVKSIAPTKQSNLCSMHCNVSFRIELIVQNISVYVLILMVSYDVPRREGLRKRKIMISRALQKSKYLFS